MSICLNSKIMTSNSRESSPSNPYEFGNIIQTQPRVYGSLQEFLKGLDDELNKKDIPEKKSKIETQISPQTQPQIQPPNNKDKKLELVESGSFLDFLLGGFNAKKIPNKAPLNNPPIPFDILKANTVNQDPILNFLGNCIPREKPANNPSKARGNNLSELPQSARYC